MRLTIAFFFSPHTPADHVKPQSPLPPPVTKRGAAWKEKPESAEVGTWRREEVQTLGGEGLELGVRGAQEPVPPPTRTLTAGSLGSPRGSSGVWAALGEAYESNLRPSGPELPVRFTERLRLPCFPLALRCVAFGDPIFVAETTI